MEAADVKKKLMAALEHEPRVNLHRDRVEVDFADGAATLSGEVSDIAAKKLTLEYAAALPAVSAVVDRLRVRPTQQLGDGAIAAHIERDMFEESSFGGFVISTRTGDGETEKQGEKAEPSSYSRNPPRLEEASGRSSAENARGPSSWIEIRVEDGVVTLDGDVPSLSHKRLAGALAWWAPGTRDVIDGLGVEPEEQDTDDEILDALRIVLDKDRLVDTSQIMARCENGVITLEGLAVTDSQRDLVEMDAWALFGVNKVVNRIEVR
ncbi:MAG TPA: BON domain-containing protein [Gammaproteobacteria bacterium]|nr:BON domain-containing protein [Gammaproteobacteria bacterium]